MRIGIEFTSCRDAIGRKHFRIAPYFRGTDRQKTYSFGTIFAALAIITIMALGMVYTDVPPQKPHVDLTPWQVTP